MIKHFAHCSTDKLTRYRTSCHANDERNILHSVVHHISVHHAIDHFWDHRWRHIVKTHWRILEHPDERGDMIRYSDRKGGREVRGCDTIWYSGEGGKWEGWEERVYYSSMQRWLIKCIDKVCTRRTSMWIDRTCGHIVSMYRENVSVGCIASMYQKGHLCSSPISGITLCDNDITHRQCQPISQGQFCTFNGSIHLHVTSVWRDERSYLTDLCNQR